MIVLLLPAMLAAGQVDVVTQTIEGREFYVHQVEQGQTLYAISRLYKVTIEDITRQNPDVVEGLRIGQTLTIAVPEGADTDKWENPIDIRDGLLVHRVKRGETLFAISRSYKVDINEILSQNPQAENGLSKGQELLIPFNDVDEAGIGLTVDTVTPARPDSLMTHTVQPGQTLYGISKQFDVEIGALEALNPELSEGLKAGQLIRLPIANPNFASPSSGGVMQAGDLPKPLPIAIPILGNPAPGESFGVSLLLPFHVEQVDTALLNRKQRRLQDISLQMYRGSMLAFDTLAKRGFNAKISVHDLQGGGEQTEAVLRTEQVRNSHLVIGPIQRSAMGAVAADLGPKGVHMVCPVPQSNRVLLSHPNLSKTVASSLTQMSQLGTHVAKAHATDNIILINSNDTRDVRNVLFFKNAFDAEIALHPEALSSQLRVVDPVGRTAGAVKGALKPGVRNIVVAPLQDQSVLQDLLTKLGLAMDEEIVLYGMENWLGMDLIDIEYKERFHITVPSSSFVDYTAPHVQAFIRAYRARFDADPSTYAFTGYDVALHYGTGLMTYGAAFPLQFGSWTTQGLLASGYDLEKTGVESGYENTHCFLLTHTDYQLQAIPFYD